MSGAKMAAEGPKGGFSGYNGCLPAHPQKFEATGFDLTGLWAFARTLVPTVVFH